MCLVPAHFPGRYTLFHSLERLPQPGACGRQGTAGWRGRQELRTGRERRKRGSADPQAVSGAG